LKFYADVHRTKKNSERYRITYTTDGTTFKHVDSFSEIPAKPGDRLFMDTLPPQHMDGAIELLRRTSLQRTSSSCIAQHCMV
jgi:hypothetical protein